MAAVMFFLAAPLAIAGALGAAMLRNPFYAVLSLVIHLLALAALFLLLRAEFLAAAQVIIYAGGVMVLYVFVVAYVGGDGSPSLQTALGPRLRLISIIFCVALATELMIALLGTGLQQIDGRGAAWDPRYGTPGQIGELLLTKFLFPFEAASILLLSAAVGAVVLARRRPLKGSPDAPKPIVEIPLPPGVGSMKEGVGRINPTAEMGHLEGNPDGLNPKRPQ